MNAPPTAKRAACDRCHRLKMRCIVPAGRGQGLCSRCQIAETPCHFSVPRKPGRPPARPAGAAMPELAAVVSPETAAPPEVAGANPAEAGSGVDDLHSQDEALSGTESLAELTFNATSWPFVAFPDGFPGMASAPLSLNETSFLQDFWTTEHKSDRLSPPIPPSHLPPTPLTPLQPPVRESVTVRLNEAGPAGAQPAAPMPIPFESPTAMDLDSGQRYMQRLSDFNVRLARAIDLGADAGPSQIEEAAAHVLESSATFLDMVNFLQSPGWQDTSTSKRQEAKRRRQGHGYTSTGTPTESRDDGDNNNNHSHDSSLDGDAVAYAAQTKPHVLDMATVLQLVVFSMRLTELYQDLYSAIYGYMQQQNDDKQLQPAEPGVRSSRSAADAPEYSLFCGLPISLNIAGVSLTPDPRFQLDLLLQTGEYYLGRVQEALSGLKALRPDMLASLPIHPQHEMGGALLVRLLMMQDQQGRMSAIREVVEKLRKGFGLAAVRSG